MKLIYVVIDGTGDLPISELGDQTPLEVADTSNMDFLAKVGKTSHANVTVVHPRIPCPCIVMSSACASLL